jgi:hypothetical protein
MKRKNLKKINFFEKNKQIQMFGYDNLLFKTVNLPKKQKFKNICVNFNLKKLDNKVHTSLTVINIQLI